MKPNPVIQGADYLAIRDRSAFTGHSDTGFEQNLRAISEIFETHSRTPHTFFPKS